MKNGINDILNSLFSSPSDKAALSLGKDSASAKGSQPGGSTFEDVLAQLAAQETESAGLVPGNVANSIDSPVVEVVSPSLGTVMGSEGNNFFRSLTSISEVDITISEHIKVSNLGELVQAEQTLLSLAVGLSKLIGLLSNVQTLNAEQAKNVLASLPGVKISDGDAEALLDSLQSMISKVSDSENPLLLSSGQQSLFLNQMLQQMLQNQQVLFGALSTAPGSAADLKGEAPSFSGMSVFQETDVFLQMSFSETQIVQFQQTNTQSSRVFIDLQTFQMSATFVQTGSASLPEMAVDSGRVLKPIPASSSLLDAMAQIFADQLSLATPTSVANQSGSSDAAKPEENLYKNFKNLVQMLVQAGASQAVLTSFLNNQRDLSNADLKKVVTPIFAMDNFAKPLVVVDASSVPAAIQGEINGSFSSQLFSEQVVAQFSTLEVLQNDARIISADSSVSLEVNQGSEDTIQLLPSGTGTLSQPGLIHDASSAETNVINALNDTVSRLNVFSSQAFAFNSKSLTNVQENKSVLSLEQLVTALSLSSSATGLTTDSLPSASNADEPIHSVSSMSDAPVSSVSNKSEFVGDELTNILNSNNLADEIAVANASIAITRVALSQTSLSASVALRNNSEDITLVSQTQLTQTSLLAERVSVERVENVLSNPPVWNFSNEVSPLASENDLIPNVSNVLSPSSNRVPAGLNPSNSIGVPNPVDSNPVDLQIKPLNVFDVVSATNIQAPAAMISDEAVPFSTIQNVLVSAMGGEEVKLAPQVLNLVKNNVVNESDLNSQPSANGVGSIAAGVQPLIPQSVTAVAGADLSADLKVSADQTKSTNNNSIDVQLNPDPLQSILSSTADKLSLAINNSGQASNNSSAANKVDSFQILSQVTDQMVVHASEVKAVSRLSFQLIPESLGRVTVQIALVDHSVSAKIIVSHPDVKESLSHHMVELKTALNQAGLQIDQLQVQIGGGSSNLLAQYYQYQQEGSGYRLPASMASVALDEVKNVENAGVLGEMSVRMSLLDVLV